MEINFLFNLNTEIPSGGEYSAYKYGYIEGVLDISLDNELFFMMTTFVWRRLEFNWLIKVDYANFAEDDTPYYIMV
ncbi:hypothetical protein QFZ80_005023 [Paenibacillus sp. V4I7]|nr:hypothetical protein [Paenibacillus sp. V4I7]